MNLHKKVKRGMFYLIVAVCSILLLIGGGYWVYAAMTATDRKENDFQIGQVETEIIEVFDDTRTEVKLDEVVQKDVLIKNTGTINQFIRVMVLAEVRAPITGDPVNQQVLPLLIGTDLLLENGATADWTNGQDGYYYYKKEAVEPNKKTSKLFESVRLSDQLAARYQQAELSITLKVETINCSEFSYRDAWWQGTTPAQAPLKDVDDHLNGMTDN
ncbi:hypothetical protein [Enterococcus sp. AZ163]|uniref:hypothetical protein n=1 Tax=Enterococcus sp. AZ163 TaxID=2774638 RepID=UPI003D2E65F6